MLKKIYISFCCFIPFLFSKNTLELYSSKSAQTFFSNTDSCTECLLACFYFTSHIQPCIKIYII